MPARYEDWLRQAKRDLKQAVHSQRDGFYEWACFISQQAAEKAIKALYQKIGAIAWGHSVSALLANLPGEVHPQPGLIDKAKQLDKHYIPPRYPNSHPSGAPLDYYTKAEAEGATRYAQEVISFCENNIFR